MADFENIVGYGYVKKAFADILTTMEHSKELKQLGVLVPHYLLLSGSDHRGKAFMAKEFAKASGRTVFDYSYETAEPDTAEKLMELFLHPDMKQKYIVNLTDLDCFAREDGKDIANIRLIMDEDAKYVTGDIFFLATADDPGDLPVEIRDRFQDRICIDLPRPDDTREIYRHLLSAKNLHIEMDEDDAVKAVAIKSYRSMERILDKAIILEQRRDPEAFSAQNGQIHLHASSFTDAVLDFFNNKGLHGGKRDPLMLEHTSFHEAGHALVAELLQPGIVGFVEINEDTGSESGGGVFLCNNWERAAWENDADVVMNLAGKAAEEIVYGRDFGGAANDIRDSYKRLCYLVVGDGIDGLEFTQPCREKESISDAQLSKQEQAIQARLIKDFTAAKKLVTEHREALDEIARALRENRFVPASVIQKAVKKG